MASDEGKFLQATVMYRDGASPTEDSASTPLVDESTELLMASPFYAVREKPDENTAPMFAAATIMREINENETGNVGAPVTATDAEGDSIAYSKSGGADMDAFEHRGRRPDHGRRRHGAELRERPEDLRGRVNGGGPVRHE